MSMETRAGSPGSQTIFDNVSEQSGLCFLPREIFWMVLGYLSAKDIIVCRRVSQTWNGAFGDPINLIPLLKDRFPLAREVRELREAGFLDELNLAETKNSGFLRSIFDRVACRYCQLALGKPRSIQKYKLCDDFGDSGEREFFPVQPWESHASHYIQMECTFPETLWSYEEGLLVYPSADHHRLVLIDLNSENDQCVIVPFLITGKVVRRVRLRHRLLVVDWAEPNAFHWLNDSDGVHRHFASSFDVTRNSDFSNDSANCCPWTVTFRNEWKIMFLGHPLSERDRFFSSHTKTHYAIYIWQPNRSLYTADEDAPIESLTVWDISTPSSYRPSLDPTGQLKEADRIPGPFVTTRFGFRELGFYSVRQRGSPRIQRLEVTDDGQSVEITENVSVFVLHTFPGQLNMAVEFRSDVHKITIPTTGIGPCFRQKLNETQYPAYRGNNALYAPPLVVFPDEVDQYTAGKKTWNLVISEATDHPAQVRFCLHSAPGSFPYLDMRMSVWTPLSRVTLCLDDISQLVAKGQVCGDERVLVGENNNRDLVVYRFDR